MSTYLLIQSSQQIGRGIQTYKFRSERTPIRDMRVRFSFDGLPGLSLERCRINGIVSKTIGSAGD